jgi:hypothetical protein
LNLLFIAIMGIKEIVTGLIMGFVLNFVFYGDEANSVPRVYPKAYTDAMAYIEAHRRTLLSEQLASGRKEGSRTTRFPL